MGNRGCNPTYRSYFTPFITGDGAHLAAAFSISTSTVPKDPRDQRPKAVEYSLNLPLWNPLRVRAICCRMFYKYI